MHISARTANLQPALGMYSTMGSPEPWSPAANIQKPLAPPPTAIHAARDEEIVAQDAKADYCYLVTRGCVRTVRLMEDGRRHVGEFLFAGDVFGLEALDRHDFGVEAVTPATLHRFPSRDLALFADSNANFARRMREVTARQVRAAREHMVLLGRKTAAEKIASFVLEMADRTKVEERKSIDLPMARGDIADYLGLTVETVCRQLTQLRLEGVIGVKGTEIAILDRRMLEAVGCQRVLH